MRAGRCSELKPKADFLAIFGQPTFEAMQSIVSKFPEPIATNLWHSSFANFLGKKSFTARNDRTAGGTKVEEA